MEEKNKNHYIWYEFSEYFSQWYFYDLDFESGDINVHEKVFDSTKMIGYDAIEKVEQYVETHEDIYVINVDDSVFASSVLVFIPHPEMGITVIFIPQCTTIPNQFFLYPNMIERVQNKLDVLKKKYNINEEMLYD